MYGRLKIHTTRALTPILVFLIGLISGCSEHNSTTTTVITNINGYSFNNDRELERFTTLVIDSGKVVVSGDRSIAESLTDAEIIDGQGQTLLPGITDAHGHVSSLGYTLLQIDLRDTTSADQAAKEIAQYAEQKRFLNGIGGRGWNQVLWLEK